MVSGTVMDADLFPPEDLKLFDDFEPVSREQWEEKVIEDLKGAPFNKLNWKTGEGFNLEPFYTLADIPPEAAAKPGSFPFTRSAKEPSRLWQIQQTVYGYGRSRTEMATVAKEAAAAEAESLLIMAGVPGSKSEIASAEHLKEVLSQTESLNTLTIHVEGEDYYHSLKGLSLSDLFAVGAAEVSLYLDPYIHALRSGKLPDTEANITQHLKEAIETLKSAGGPHRAVCVHGEVFKRAGATITEELAYSLAAGNEYMAALVSAGLSVDDAAKSISFSLPAGTRYFPEIGKYRAARRLWSLIVSAYKPAGEQVSAMTQHGGTSLWNLSLYDRHTNLLRTTTQAMAAIIGGVDTLRVHPFDAPFATDDEFSRRMARNIQFLARYESYLGVVSDPAGGSYYIEKITDEIAHNAYEIFQDIEKQGGFLKAAGNGRIQSGIGSTSLERETRLAVRKDVFVGVNHYPNTGEVLKEGKTSGFDFDAVLEYGYGDVSALDSGEAVEKLRLFRGPEKFEKLRLETEKLSKEKGKRPLIQLIPLGKLTMQRARAAFCVNLFGVAGFEVNDPGSLGKAAETEPVKKLVEEKKSAISAVVLCSADEEYAEILNQNGDLLKSLSVPVIVAGAPKDAEQLKAAGVSDFVNVKSNVYDTLKKYQQQFFNGGSSK